MTNEQKAYYASLSSEELAEIMMAYQENADSTYEGNLKKLGVVDIDSPTSISIYPTSFDSKEIIADEIEKYNSKMKDEGTEEDVITYSDLVGTMMSSVSTIVNLISDVLIAFVSISLVVSSIMIGIITYISVLERTKEIGILRAMGASKKDISRVFNAEAFIIGLIAGLIGIGITVLLTIPINSIIYMVSGVELKTALPLTAGVVLVVLSVILTSIGGLIPAKIASKKDPVNALRTE
jgi:putative ABC transport system permease protein